MMLQVLPCHPCDQGFLYDFDVNLDCFNNLDLKQGKWKMNLTNSKIDIVSLVICFVHFKTSVLW
jgi:hypothetical protein